MLLFSWYIKLIMSLVIFQINSESLINSLVNVIEKNIIRRTYSQHRKRASSCLVGFGILNLSKTCFDGCLLGFWHFNNSENDNLSGSEASWNEHLIIDELFVWIIIMGLLKNITFNIYEVLLCWIPSLSFVIFLINDNFGKWILISNNFRVFNDD